MDTHADIAKPTIDTHELKAVLEEYWKRNFGEARRIRHLERRLSDYRSSYVLENVDVILEGENILPLVLKDLSKKGLMEGARSAKPASLYDPMREIATYRQILEPAALGTARCYAAVANADTGRYFLLLERVDG